MAFTMRAVKVPPNSASLEEARHRVFDFFKQACRSIPTIMEIYNLDDVVTPSQLRSTIAKEIRKNQNVTNPKERDTNRNPPLVQPVNQCNCASAGMHGSTPANEQRGVACGGLRECRPTTNLPTRLGCTAASVKCISMLVVAKAASVAG